jgi:hypothetical protein
MRIDNMRRLRIIKENTFKNMTQLRSLSISGCRQLRSFHRDAFGHKFEPVNMERLALRNNGLKSLDRPGIDLDKIKVVDLQGNPWKCDCGLEWMSELRLPRQLSGELK